ncbi:unnamed protein product [Phaedon cochleariae]|uniref:Hyaluronidase n=1 Tax=Phaedon cochleariae TaxID=80249 RepID=A0A9P0DAS9_PHACE|nr:unnamed protein product [Phaedon cochleariae]
MYKLLLLSILAETVSTVEIRKHLLSWNIERSIKRIAPKQTKVYWNIPTFQCDYHQLNFTGLATKYGIIQNEKDRFHGDQINILYDPGDFPAILKNGSASVLRNGGVPQAGNLTKHLEIFAAFLDELIPDDEFAGVGVIDFESWRPIFRQNFGVLEEYKNLSIAIEKRKHPFWPTTWIEKEAKIQFESSARKFMEETLFLAKLMRPNATWGYYGYPYCFNMSPNNMRGGCPKEVVEENNRLEWLFELTDNLYPSIYLENIRLNESDRVKLIEGRIEESHRVIKRMNKKENTNIVPYFWYKYHDTHEFLSKNDLFNAFTVLASSDINGLVIWGSSNDVNTKKKCIDDYQYIDNILGPLLQFNF